MLLQIQNLKKSYFLDNREIQVLKGLNWNLEAGEMCSIIGPSGVGKSTLLHIIGSLDSPSDGTVLFDGVDIFELKNHERDQVRNNKIGFVFQFHHLLPELTAIENVMLPALINRTHREIAREKAEKRLQQVGLKERLLHKPGELSGGEQQRVALARALVMDPILLLADEPTGNLDENTSMAIHDLMFQLNEELNVTCVVVTHQTSFAKKMKKTVLLKDGLVEDVIVR